MPAHRVSKTTSERMARDKAATPVYISGIAGAHPLATGLAYYYRGHYLYACPGRTLLEPLPFSVRHGITIQGVVSGSAPAYDPGARLVPEARIRALDAAVDAERRRERDVAAAAAAAAAAPAPTPAAGPAGASLAAIAPLVPLAPSSFTPRPGAAHTAASAPGSRLASRAASPAALRPHSSALGLARLGAIPGPAPPPADEDLANVCAEHGEVGYLVGLGDHALVGERGREKVRCVLHGEGCGGVETGSEGLTEETRRGRGFVEEVPMVEVGGRVMVDWAGLLREARGGE
ncbi:hypothetical protein C7974DRAFT_416477 [Boeremia exigua]|uniref:uncharacterized protein n=1 Tax=Boeremia exigua TaxID=749465 RepID=UPI001E8E2508|nr:uncharacterized protein C7974DRAFT_416477 [Boeremia exigua]KAH6616331.1 hypothetical protein C7974DRAFT_416477 [Boeremia exigua]